MKTLADLSPSEGSVKERKRIGRGIGSGTGKTAGKGHKGQKARKGSGPAPGFEGGQTPLYRRIPKRGFSGPKGKATGVRLDHLNRFAEGSTVSVVELRKAGLMNSGSDIGKVILKGQLEKKLTLKGLKVSAGARTAIEKAGGLIEE